MLSVKTEHFRDVTVIRLCGLLTREYLRDADEAWNEGLRARPAVMALDFREVSQIDSYSLNHLVHLARSANEKEVPLYVCGVNESLRKIFEVVKLNRIVNIIPWHQFETEYLRGR